MFRLTLFAIIMSVACSAHAEQSAACVERLEQTLARVAPDAVVRIDEVARGPSIVDETEELRRAHDVSTALVVRGPELHVVSPLVSHAEARRWARQIGRTYDESEMTCGLADLLDATAEGRRSSRWGFALVSALCGVLALLSGLRLSGLRLNRSVVGDAEPRASNTRTLRRG